MISELVKIAQSQVGIRESGSNSGLDIRKYQAATGLKPDNWPWCAAFICWSVKEWLADPLVEEWLGLKVMTPEQWRPKTARAYGFLPWAKDRPKTTSILRPEDRAEPGDIVFYTFSHVGLVVSAKDGVLHTIEGNTNGEGSREGDGVYAKTRSVKIVRGYVRIKQRS
jgi:hypothetical protein